MQIELKRAVSLLSKFYWTLTEIQMSAFIGDYADWKRKRILSIKTFLYRRRAFSALCGGWYSVPNEVISQKKNQSKQNRQHVLYFVQ